MQFKDRIKKFGGVALLCITFLVVGMYLGYTDRPAVDSIVGIENKEDSNVTADFDIFWKTWKILNDKSIIAKDVSDQDKVWGAVKGLTSAYNDPYTEFYNPKETKQFDEAITGEFSGVGMEVGNKNGILTVIAPIKGSPAERAGIKSGDVILKINDESTDGLSIDQAVQKIRGEAGTKVNLNIFHKGDEATKDVEVTRAVIVVPSIETKVDGDYFIISMATFTGNNINQDITKSMTEFKNSGKKKMIIDVRGNPGGYLESAIFMASYFLPEGTVVVSEDYGDKQDSVVHKSQGIQLFDKSVKVAVLIDGGSASASEILAGALHDNDRAIIVGEKSYGKGSVQEIVQVTKDTILKVTIAKWLTPKGISIQDNGITPENIVEIPKDWKTGDKDPQLEKAKALLK